MNKMNLTNVLEEKSIEELKKNLRGSLLRPGEEGYETACKIFNAMIDKRPGLIVKSIGVADVITTVNFVRENNLLLAVKGGGHSVAGHALCDGCIMIDLSNMKGIRVDPKERTVRAEAGVILEELDHETHIHGLATTLGTISVTGIAGLTLGGGIGWLMGRYGLACDNLISVDIVTADGRYITASERENQDLFWGIKGGGGNFGIATSFEYKLYPVSQVLAGLILWPFDKVKEVLQFYRDFTKDEPDELGTIFAVATSPDGVPVIGVAVCYSGDIENGKKVLKPLREFGSPIVDAIGPMQYDQAQKMLNETAPSGKLNYWKSAFLKELSDDVIETIVSYSKDKPSPITMVHIWSHHGKVNKIKTEDTAFSNRNYQYNFHIVSIWEDKNESEKNLQWAKSFWKEMEPFMSNQVYLNFVGSEEEAKIKAAYGDNYERLVALKNKYDPTNLFRMNQNIKPS